MTSEDHRVAVITGAAGGIGSATARRLGRLGYRLALSDLDARALEGLAEELRGEGIVVSTRTLDLREREGLEVWAEDIASKDGCIHLLVNNAGVTTWGRYRDQSAEDIDWLMDINVRALMHTCHVFLPLLRRAKGGHIVNVSSMIALFSGPLQTTYTASKWAVLGFSRALRLELRGEGVGVSCVLPGLTATPFMSDSRSYDAAGTSKMGHLMRRYGMSPERVARAIHRAILRNRAEVHVGIDCHLVAFSQRFLPRLLPWLIDRIYPRLVSQGKLRIEGEG